MTRLIASVGFELAGSNVRTVHFNSRESLIDWDIILFAPDISSQLYGEIIEQTYKGKLCLGDHESFRLREACEHWRRELKEAVDAGKTVIGFLTDVVEVYIATGENTYSGTGRNRITTSKVREYSNYQSIPISASPTSRSGAAIKSVDKYSGILSSYWREFGGYSTFKATFPKDTKGACLVTKHGELPVGLMLSQRSGGTLLLLPELIYNSHKFVEFDGDGDYPDDDEDYYTEEFKQFNARLVSSVVALDKVLRSHSDRTPEPSWASQPRFSLFGESEIIQALLVVEQELEKARERKEELVRKRVEEASLRDLLFETGRTLERAVLKALTLLEFSVEQYGDGESEFDVIFESREGRFLGEVEGKDSRPVDISKLRQLAMNIHEDLNRAEIEEPAKGILFGNGNRLEDPSNRQGAFTDKCMKMAVSTSSGLVDTVQLFWVVQYLSISKDEEFARDCRAALANSNGLVGFPKTPEPTQDHECEQLETGS